jgi:hypothetical protein
MGHLHASTSLRMGTGVARILESDRTDPGYHCGRPPYLDSGLEHCADSRYRQAGTDPLLFDHARTLSIYAESDVCR